MKLFAISAAILALILIAPPARAQQDDLASVDPSIAPLPATQTVAPEAVLKLVQEKDSSIALVDTQPVDGYAEGHIPGAMNYPWVMRIAKFPISLPRNKTLIMYGSCPHDTEDLIRQLAEYGYFNIKVMDGGWYKWVALKYPAVGKGATPSVQVAAEQTTAAQNKSEKPATR